VPDKRFNQIQAKRQQNLTPLILSTKLSQKTTMGIVVRRMPWMPLTRGKIVGHDGERLAFVFIMLNGDEPVECRISDAAMDELIGVKGTENSARQAQFLAHRDAIEKVASDLYDEKPAVKGAVLRIFTKHVHPTG
jgi:Protein of unknown function (DUF1488)